MDYQHNLNLRDDMSCGHQFATANNGCSQCYGAASAATSSGFPLATGHLGGYEMPQGNEYFCSQEAAGPSMLPEYFVTGSAQSFIPYQYQPVNSTAHLYPPNTMYNQPNMSNTYI